MEGVGILRYQEILFFNEIWKQNILCDVRVIYNIQDHIYMLTKYICLHRNAIKSQSANTPYTTHPIPIFPRQTRQSPFCHTHIQTPNRIFSHPPATATSTQTLSSSTTTTTMMSNTINPLPPGGGRSLQTRLDALEEEAIKYHPESIDFDLRDCIKVELDSVLWKYRL